MRFPTFSLLLTVVLPSVLAHPTTEKPPGSLRIIGRETSATIYSDEFDALVQGNQDFKASQASSIKRVAPKQEPKFLFIGCADSRASESSVFNAQVGTFFTERNIANMYEGRDSNARASIAYGVEHLHVKHIIVMGHYGCGGIQASIASPPPQPWDEGTKLIQEWIKPIRKTYMTSQRPEIVALRKKNQKLKTPVPGPPAEDPGFRALVEENIKSTVANLATDDLILEHWNNPKSKRHPLYIHGWVYNIADGEVSDLGVSVGPPGEQILVAPFTEVAKIASSDALKRDLH